MTGGQWIRWQIRLRSAAIALAVLLVASIVQSSVAQTSKQTVSTELAGKKAAMLEMFLSSRRLSKILLQFPNEAEPLVQAARVHLLNGLNLMDENEPVGAAQQFDKGIGAVSKAMALSAAKQEAPANENRRANENRLREVRTYLGVLARAPELDGKPLATLNELQERLKEIEERAEAGDEAGAWKIANEIYPRVVRLVSQVQHGQTGFVSKVFDTPEEALEYERARFDNHRMLVGLALAERGDFQPGLDALAANLTTLGNRLHDEAEAHATAGRVVDAVETMQRATERLSAILRAAGLVVPDSEASR